MFFHRDDILGEQKHDAHNMSSSVEIESINDATPQHLKHPKQMHRQQPPGRTYECESWCREASR